MIAALLALTVGGLYVGSAVATRHRAQAAADLAALAAAGRIAQGTGAACAYASTVARRMHTAVTRCVLDGPDGLDVVVAVQAAVALGSFGVGSAHAAARAGPVDWPG